MEACPSELHQTLHIGKSESLIRGTKAEAAWNPDRSQLAGEIRDLHPPKQRPKRKHCVSVSFRLSEELRWLALLGRPQVLAAALQAMPLEERGSFLRCASLCYNGILIGVVYLVYLYGRVGSS